MVKEKQSIDDKIKALKKKKKEQKEKEDIKLFKQMNKTISMIKEYVEIGGELELVTTTLETFLEGEIAKKKIEENEQKNS